MEINYKKNYILKLDNINIIYRLILEVIILKNRTYIMAVIGCVIIACIFLYFVVSIIFTNIYGNKINREKIIKIFTSNIVMFEDAIKEIDDVEEIYIRKQQNSYYDVIENDTEKIIDIQEDVEEYLNYKKCIDIMEELDISYLSKDYNNISFTMNSMFGLGQQIVYISDMEKYKFGHPISYTKNIENNWYYIETK
jgi:hypothetical protein